MSKIVNDNSYVVEYEQEGELKKRLLPNRDAAFEAFAYIHPCKKAIRIRDPHGVIIAGKADNEDLPKAVRVA